MSRIQQVLSLPSQRSRRRKRKKERKKGREKEESNKKRNKKRNNSKQKRKKRNKKRSIREAEEKREKKPNTSKNGSCAAIFGMLRCRRCTATLAFLQCGCHFDKRKTAMQHWNSCVAGKWRFPAAFLRISGPHAAGIASDSKSLAS